MTTTKKIAVDEAAKRYWEEYLGDYGRLWVRDIPRNVRAALDRDTTTKVAVSGNSEPDVVPLGHAVTADRLILDGVIRGDSAMLFRAEFNHDGEIVDIQTRAAPAA